MNRRIYLDYNATTPVMPEVWEAVVTLLRKPGNPSSIHGEGRKAKAVLRKARQQVAGLVGAKDSQVIFTGGGTEANNLVLSPQIISAGHAASARLFVGATEHASVLAGGRFVSGQVSVIPVGREGQITGDVLQQFLEGQLPGQTLDRKAGRAEATPFMVSVMMANNETGQVQDIAALGEIVHRFGGLFHVDAVQAAGKMNLDFEALPVDFMSVSAHKIGGMQGVGALIAKDPDLVLKDVLVRGGGQERNRRGGTENLPGIVSFGLAAEICAGRLETERSRLEGLRNMLEEGLGQINDEIVIVARKGERLPNTLCFLSKGLRAENMLMTLDLAGIAVSSGSACSSGKVTVSHVLQAMGYEDDLCNSAIRVSFGWQSEKQDVTAFLSVYADMFLQHKKHHAAA